jgi:hypothetical protein
MLEFDEKTLSKREGTIVPAMTIAAFRGLINACIVMVNKCIKNHNSYDSVREFIKDYLKDNNLQPSEKDIEQILQRGILLLNEPEYKMLLNVPRASVDESTANYI